VIQYGMELSMVILLCANIDATYWTVTSYYQLSLTVSHYGTRTESYYDYAYTSTRTVQAGVTPTAKAVSSTTRLYTHDDLSVVELYIAQDSVPESDLEATTTTEATGTSTPYTSSQWCTQRRHRAQRYSPFETNTYVRVPAQVTSFVTATANSTSVATVGECYTFVTAYLPPGAVPLSTVATQTDWIYTYYIAKCRNPTASGAAYWGPGSSLGGGSSDNFMVCSALTGCTTFRTRIVGVATVLPTLFVLGFAESYFWFIRLMIGKGCLRLGTICWVLLSLWIICFTRGQPARSEEDQVALRKQWDEMNGGTRWKLWWKLGVQTYLPRRHP
jgi:hypothetical protein